MTVSRSLLFQMAGLIREMADRLAMQRSNLAKDADLAAHARHFLRFNGFVDPKAQKRDSEISERETA